MFKQMLGKPFVKGTLEHSVMMSLQLQRHQPVWKSCCAASAGGWFCWSGLMKTPRGSTPRPGLARLAGACSADLSPLLPLTLGLTPRAASLSPHGSVLQCLPLAASHSALWTQWASQQVAPALLDQTGLSSCAARAPRL